MRSGSRSGKNMKKHEILMKNRCENRRLRKHIARCFLQNMRFWRVTIFHGFWSSKSLGKSITSGTFGARGPDFPDFGQILWPAEFDDFLIGEKSVENLDFCGRLRFGAIWPSDLAGVGGGGGALGV